MADIKNSALELIGGTPLLKADRYSRAAGVEGAALLAKLEYLNPAGSVKDRIAWGMIRDAEEKGILKEGATIIEPTSGNTGIGLAAVAAARGYQAIFTLPETMSVERRKLLKAYGLVNNVPDLVGCPTCGRTAWDLLAAIRQVEDYLETVRADIRVAVMGCVVNGPGEAREADIGVAGGHDEALLFRKGQIIRKIPQADIVSELKKEIEEMIKEG